jgi:tetratricopeptide (TPR) repeat protein
VQPATELVGLEPFRESAHLRLMRAHMAAGDRAEALRAYNRCRRLLAEELGVDPSSELRAAYLDLLDAEPAAAAGGQPAEHAPAPSPTWTDSEFVGRSLELARLRAAWVRARAGQRRAVLVTGEAGIGKSRLAAELTTLAERAGATVLLGRCDGRPGVSYLPFRTALGPYLSHYPTERLPSLLGPRGGELVRLWPELARRVPGLPGPSKASPEGEHHLLFEAVVGLLDAVAAGSPVVLAVEDLHDADVPSLLLLRHLVLAPHPAALLVVATYRDDGSADDGLDDTVADVIRTPGGELLALGGLDVGEVAAFAEGAVGVPLGSAGATLARALHERTGGNPFFVGELLRHLAERGMLAGADLTRTAVGPAVDDVPLPVRRVVGQRLSRLGAPVVRALEAVAVIGHQADLTLLARVVDLGYDELVSALDVAVRAKVLQVRPGVPGRYAFTHAIVSDHVYTGLPAARRARLHRRVGEELERLAGGAGRIGELANHFALGAEAGGAAKAAEYAGQAGDQAFAQLLYEEAAHRYQQALTALERGSSSARQDELLLALGAAWTNVGNIERASTAYLRAADAARAAKSAEGMARAGLGLGGPTSFWSLQVDGAVAVALLREALAALDEADVSLRARVLARLGGWLWVQAVMAGSPGADLAPFEEAVALARRAADPATLALVLADRAHALSAISLARTTKLDDALASSAELVALAARIGDGNLTYKATLTRGEALLSAGDLDGLERLFAAGGLPAESRQVPYHGWLSMAARTTVASLRGDFAAAERLAAQALERGKETIGEQPALLGNTIQLVVLRWLQGRHDDVLGILREQARTPSRAGWDRLLPLACVGRGDQEAVRAQLAAAAADDFGGPRSVVELVALTGACAMLGDPGAAKRLYDLLLPLEGWHLSVAVTVYLGSADHHLGVLAATSGCWEGAERHLFDALTAHRRLGARPWFALSAQALAGMLRGRAGPGDHDRAEQFDASARAASAPLGMKLTGWGRPTLGPRG